MPPEVERRLAAILAADVAGYSRLMADDEEATIRTLRAWREQVTALIGEHRGRLVDFTGDNFLAEFAAARAALECALEIQRVIESRNAAQPESRRMRFRIGAHLGDVRVEDGRLFGDGVNAAARLQGLSEPGGLCLSATIVDATRGKLELELEDLGEQALKNLPMRLRAYRVRPAALLATPRTSAARFPLATRFAVATGIAAAVLAATVVVWIGARNEASEPRASLTALAAPEKTATATLAVLPFVNLSDDANQTYFAEGLSEELINVLTQIRGLKVAGRTSSFAFKGQNVGIDVIGKRLGVEHVLEGSVRRGGNVLRVTAQLVSTRDGFHLWSETYDRELVDVLHIQREIAEAVAGVLELQLGLVGSNGGTASPTAHAHYLVGKALFWQHTAPTTERAIDELEAALRIDPEFPLAWIELSFAYGGRSRDPLQRQQSLERMADAAARAHELAPALWRSESARSWVAMSFHDFTEAELAMQHAVALRQASGNEGVDLDLSSYLWNLGRPSEQLIELERLRHRDPLVSSAGALHVLGRRTEAVAEYERVRQLGAARDALFESALALDGADAGTTNAIIPGFAQTPTGRTLLGPSETALAALRAELVAPTALSRGSYAVKAVIAERHGDLALALALLRREYESPGFGSYFLLWYPGLRATRATPGFKEFVREIGLHAMWRETGRWNDFCRPVNEDDFVCK